MFQIDDGKGKTVSLVHTCESINGDTAIELAYNILWCQGYVRTLCASERVALLSNNVAMILNLQSTSADFTSDEGSITISIVVRHDRHVNIHVIAMPTMIGDDKIEFSFNGLIDTTTFVCDS